MLAALAGFLLRQPLTLLVKVRSGRRGRDGLPAIRFWIAVWGLLAALCVAELARRGFAWVLLLAAPGVPVFVWQLWLVSRRAERRQWLVEVVGSGVLALTAPAALWIGVGRPDPLKPACLPAPGRYTTSSVRTGVRAAEGAALEMPCAVFPYRGFESHPVRLFRAVAQLG